jgi:hypothetical protein
VVGPVGRLRGAHRRLLPTVRVAPSRPAVGRGADVPVGVYSRWLGDQPTRDLMAELPPDPGSPGVGWRDGWGHVKFMGVDRAWDIGWVSGYDSRLARTNHWVAALVHTRYVACGGGPGSGRRIRGGRVVYRPLVRASGPVLGLTVSSEQPPVASECSVAPVPRRPRQPPSQCCVNGTYRSLIRSPVGRS